MQDGILEVIGGDREGRSLVETGEKVDAGIWPWVTCHLVFSPLAGTASSKDGLAVVALSYNRTSQWWLAHHHGRSTIYVGLRFLVTETI